MKLFFSVGEPSGDLHGANLIRELRQRDPEIECVGLGGPRMAAAGCELHADLTQLAVMWFARALWNLPTFFAHLRRADHYFRHQRPDAVVLIDYPGFNWHIARKAKSHGIPVFYYGTPQLWAWAEWRIGKMRRTVDHALCKLPFEQPWYRDRGVNATYVGHPYFDELSARQLDAEYVESWQRGAGRLVTLLPGSRTQEVTRNAPALLAAAKKIRAQVPDTKFAVAAFKASQADYVRQLAAAEGLEVPIEVGRTPELIEAAHCCLAVSGSVSLELLYHRKPSAIVYCVSPLAHWVQRQFRKVRYITLVNLLTTDELFPQVVRDYDPHEPADAHVLLPEYLATCDCSDELAGHAVRWLTDAVEYDRVVAGLGRLKAELGQGGASRRAAEYLQLHLQPAPARRGTHFDFARRKAEAERGAA